MDSSNASLPTRLCTKCPGYIKGAPYVPPTLIFTKMSSYGKRLRDDHPAMLNPKGPLRYIRYPDDPPNVPCSCAAQPLPISVQEENNLSGVISNRAQSVIKRDSNEAGINVADEIYDIYPGLSDYDALYRAISGSEKEKEEKSILGNVQTFFSVVFRALKCRLINTESMVDSDTDSNTDTTSESHSNSPEKSRLRPRST